MTDKNPSDSTPDYMAEKFIALRAYEYWQQRGQPFGSAQIDWLRAVDEISREMTTASGARQDLK
jgi:hypothetical protein